ncbi:MAG: TolB family protein [Chitinophagaceae bacterium]
MIKKMMLVILPALMAICSLFCANTDNQVSASLATTEELNDSTIPPTGAIAYIRNSSEIRLINRDGTNDRKIWSHPNAKYPVGIFELAWRPDGRELAFSSAHNSIFSFYHSDIYTIRPDGSGFRKITTGPDHKDFGKFKKGMVSVTVKNTQYSFQQAQSSVGVFIVNVVGAKEPQHITLPPGASKTLVFKDVADFGNHAQAVVAMSGSYRWIMPGTDVQAGKNVKAPDMLISGDGIELFGAFRPIWKNDGSEISFRSGVCIISKVAVKSSGPSFVSEPMFTGEHPSGSCVWDWGPTPALANQIIYSENSSEERASIFLTKVGGSHREASYFFFLNCNCRYHQICAGCPRVQVLFILLFTWSMTEATFFIMILIQVKQNKSLNLLLNLQEDSVFHLMVNGSFMNVRQPGMKTNLRWIFG